ncbi:hypothetical protein ACHQM5_013734 [Ranunculus cassubicifolius]
MAFEVQLKQQQQLHVLGGKPITSRFLTFDLNLSLPPFPITLDLFHSKTSSYTIELDQTNPIPIGWQKCLNLKTGDIYYKREKRQKINQETRKMSRNGKNSRLDLKLNLSPPSSRRGSNQFVQSPGRSSTSSPTSPPSSCVSSENEETFQYSSSPEATSMVLVGCPRCLMYVMLSQEDPKCPKCKSTVLLDFVHDNNTKKTRKN